MHVSEYVAMDALQKRTFLAKSKSEEREKKWEKSLNRTPAENESKSSVKKTPYVRLAGIVFVAVAVACVHNCIIMRPSLLLFLCVFFCTCVWCRNMHTEQAVKQCVACFSRITHTRLVVC